MTQLISLGRCNFELKASFLNFNSNYSYYLPGYKL